jgi:hypothetical protein
MACVFGGGGTHRLTHGRAAPLIAAIEVNYPKFVLSINPLVEKTRSYVVFIWVAIFIK